MSSRNGPAPSRPASPRIARGACRTEPRSAQADGQELAAELRIKRRSGLAPAEPNSASRYTEGGTRSGMSPIPQSRGCSRIEDRRLRRAPLRHGRALRLHLDRDGGLRRQHPRHLRSRRSGRPPRYRAGGCRGSMSPAARRRPGRATRTACTTRCAGRRAVGGGVERRSARDRCLRHPQAAHGGRLQLSPAVPRTDAHRASRFRSRWPAARSRWRRTRSTTTSRASRTPGCGCSTSPISPTSGRCRCST